MGKNKKEDAYCDYIIKMEQMKKEQEIKTQNEMLKQELSENRK